MLTYFESFSELLAHDMIEYWVDGCRDVVENSRHVDESIIYTTLPGVLIVTIDREDPLRMKRCPTNIKCHNHTN